jgi:hypothetical protein
LHDLSKKKIDGTYNRGDLWMGGDIAKYFKALRTSNIHVHEKGVIVKILKLFFEGKIGEKVVLYSN